MGSAFRLLQMASDWCGKRHNERVKPMKLPYIKGGMTISFRPFLALIPMVL